MLINSETMCYRRKSTMSNRHRLKSVLSLLILTVNVFGNVTCLESSNRTSVDTSDKSILDACPHENENPKLVFLSDLAKYSHAGVKYEYLKMQCLAPYPIKWNFKGNKPNDIYFNLGIIAENFFDTKKRCYTSTLSSYKWSPQQLGRTGNYSCESLLDSKKISSVYKFMDGIDSSDPIPIIFSSPRKVKVLANPNEEDWLVLPCASNTETIKATLWTVAGNGSVNKLPESISQHYDPKIGFLLRNSHTDDNSTNTSLTGNYLCHTTINLRRTDVVEISVLEAPGFLATPETETVTPINGHVFLACEANEHVEIEISNFQGGSLREVTSEGPNVASNYNYSTSVNAHAVNEEGNISYSISGIAVCKTKSNKILHTWKFDTDHSCHCSWEFLKLEESGDDDSVDYYEEEIFEDVDVGDVTVPSKLLNLPFANETKKILPDKAFLNHPELRGRLICSNPKYSQVNFSLLHCGNENECDAKSSCLVLNECPFVTQSKRWNQTINGTSKSVSFMDVTLQSGILKCHVDGYVSTHNVIASIDNMYFDKTPENASVINILAPENKFITGDKLIFSCEVEKYQLAEPLTWFFQFKNQSTKVIDDIDPTEDKRMRSKYKIYRTSYIKMSSPDISALICSAPIWPTENYKNFSFPLFNEDIGPSVSPGHCVKNGLYPNIIMLRNSSVSLNRTRATTLVNNYTVTIEKPVDQIKLVCRAPYPVQWIKDDDELIATTNQWSNCENSDMVERKGKWYDAILEFPSIGATTTGNYTCRKVSNHSLKSFVYLFASGKSSKTILEEGKHITIVKPLDDPDPWVLFPCRTANPRVTPYFFMDNGERPKWLETNEYLIYDATKGFSLDISSLSIESSSYFYCSADNDSAAYNVLFSLHRPDGPIVFDRARPKLYYDDNSKATFIVVIAFLLVMIAILALAIGIIFRKHKENIDKIFHGNNHQMSSTYTASTENAVIDNDVEIGNGNYRRFS